VAKKQFFAIVDTETTANDTVADFAVIIVDRKGEIFNSCAVLVHDHFDKFDLFFIPNTIGNWSKQYAAEKRVAYNAMLQSGTRQLASVAAINRWINQAVGKYNPILTAYNLPFDLGKCANTGIDLSVFTNKFCLWQAAVGNICGSKAYRNFALANHGFNNVTENGNMTYKTNAEMVCGFLNGKFSTEPHTALEDARDSELPILLDVIKRKNWREKITPYDWNKHQTRDHFIAK
jgi:hypothetical protein